MKLKKEPTKPKPENLKGDKPNHVRENTPKPASFASQPPELIFNSGNIDYFKNIVNTIRDPLLVLDADLRVLTANRSFYKFFKVKQKETLGNLIYDLGNRQWDIPGLRTLLETILPQKAMFNEYEVEYDFPGIGKRVMLLNARRIPKPPKKEQWILLAFEDITGRKRGEEALRESEIRLKEAQRVGHTGSWDWDATTDTITWSEEYYRIFGFDPKLRPPGYDEHLKVYTPESVARLDAAVKHSMQTGEGYQLDLEQIRVDGTRRWIVARGEVKCDAHGQIVGLFGTAHDITDRKCSEEAVYKQQQVFRTLVENSPDIIARYDRDCKRSYVNPAYLKTAKIPQSKLLASSPTQLSPLPAASAEILQNLIRKVLDSGVAESVDVIWPKADNIDHWYSVYASPEIDREGQVESVITMSHDITDSKHKEEERKGHICYLERLGRVDRVIKQEIDVDKYLWNIIQTVFSIFDCDRAWLFYPCDPDAPSFRVPVEISRPEYPGANIQDTDVPMPPDLAQNLREALASDDPVTYTAGTERPINKVTTEQFGVQSQMFIPLYPKMGKPWVFGMHQCSYPRIWTKEEKELFQEISRRISDGLNSVLFLRELQESEERFRSTFEQAAVGIAHVTPDGQWLQVNQKLCNIIGFSKEELLQKKFQDITFPEDLDSDLKYANQLLDGEIPTYSTEKRFIRKDGSIVWIDLTVSILHHASGKPRYFIPVFKDINKRKQVAEELRTAEEKYRTIFENMMEGIFQSTPEGRFLTVNRAFARMLGYESPEEIIAKITDIGLQVYVESPQRAEFVRLMAEQGVVSEFEFQLQRKDGGIVWVSEKARAVRDANGIILYYEGNTEDITERKQAEEQIKNQVETLTALYDLSRQLVGMDDFNDILKLVTKRAVETIHITYACFLLLEQDDLVMRAFYPVRIFPKELQLDQRLPLADHPLCQRVFDGNKPLLLQSDNPEAGEFELFLHNIAQNLCIVPLHFQEQPFGILLLGEARETAREPFTPEKLRLGESIADQAASALHRTLLSEQARHRLQRIVCLREI
ncbi:MAG: PAS domain S-box protein, partial [Chloroflexota bacterium]